MEAILMEDERAISYEIETSFKPGDNNIQRRAAESGRRDGMDN
jgi:hypothetical protein